MEEDMWTNMCEQSKSCIYRQLDCLVRRRKKIRQTITHILTTSYVLNHFNLLSPITISHNPYAREKNRKRSTLAGLLTSVLDLFPIID